MWRALQGESVRDAPMMIIPKTGGSRSLLTNADPIYDAIGNQSSAVVLMRDVTSLKAYLNRTPLFRVQWPIPV